MKTRNQNKQERKIQNPKLGFIVQTENVQDFMKRLKHVKNTHILLIDEIEYAKLIKYYPEFTPKNTVEIKKIEEEQQK